MQDANKNYVDWYIPRKCFPTNRILDCKDTAFVLITLNTDGWNLENKKDEENNNFTMII